MCRFNWALLIRIREGVLGHRDNTFIICLQKDILTTLLMQYSTCALKSVRRVLLKRLIGNPTCLPESLINSWRHVICLSSMAWFNMKMWKDLETKIKWICNVVRCLPRKSSLRSCERRTEYPISLDCGQWEGCDLNNFCLELLSMVSSKRYHLDKLMLKINNYTT